VAAAARCWSKPRPIGARATLRHDDQRYVPEGEIEWWERNNDPVDRYERFLIEQNFASRPMLDSITAGVLNFIDEEVEWAEESPMPEPERAAYRVFDNDVVPPAFRPKVLER
jgi:TPP-dependent pyruvate/acetoin dehydrogenase alpha subunit